MKARTSVGCAWTIVLMLGLGASAAEAFGVKPIPADAASLTIVTPAAMCGRSCQGGGRYIAGPPSVCEQYGLNYCGPSRGGPQPGVGVYVPGTGVGVGPGGAGVYVASGSNCRTVTIERDDGSVRRIRRCD